MDSFKMKCNSEKEIIKKRNSETDLLCISKRQRLQHTELDDPFFEDHPSVVSHHIYSDLYGYHEIQVSEGGEADLHKHFLACQKNPGHTRFIPVKKFRMEDLPESYHDIDLYELIKVTADLTVRVEVKMTSPHRPEFYPDTNVPYPVYNMRNKTTLRLGTGQIDVYKFTDGLRINPDRSINNVEKYLSFFDISTKTCPCKKCQHADKPNNVWWEILVNTATHVVFDDIEASHTTCRLFYDEQDSPVVSLDKVSVGFIDIETDRCVLKYVTCDSLGDKLYNMAEHRSLLWRIVRNKYKSKHDVKLTVIVSHPHGCHKQVSVGHLIYNYKVSEYTKNYHNTKMTYTTATCPGSSGASVFLVGKFQSEDSLPKAKYNIENETHIQKLVADTSDQRNHLVSGLIRSGHVGINPFKECINRRMADYFEENVSDLAKATSDLTDDVGDIEIASQRKSTKFSPLKQLQILTTISEDFDRDNSQESQSNTSIKGEKLTTIACDVHPGHTDFKDVISFSLTDLPECYREPEMEDLIKSLAGLTVMIMVTKMENTTSENPKNETELHKSKVDYGSGKVDEVVFHSGKDCPCVKCRNSPDKKKEWAEIKIVTTSQFVYGKNDATHFETIFFYDDDEKLDNVKCLTGDQFAMVNNEGKVCIFTCFSCDTDLNVKLDKGLDRFEECWEKAFDTFATTVKWEIEKLIIIVSHPHGCKKHISIGKRVGTESNPKRITYDTPTCPGSSGAFVLVPDFDVVDDIL